MVKNYLVLLSPSCQPSEKRSHYLNIKEQGTFRTVSTSSVCSKQVLAKEFIKRETNTINKENQHPKKQWN